MTQESCLELPGHVVTKIEQVLGIPPSKLAKQDLVKLIEDLCDTALMFDRDERETTHADDQHADPQPSPPPWPSPETVS